MTTRPRSSGLAGKAVLGLSAAGFPLIELTIRHLGTRGAVAAECVTGGLLVRDVAMIAGGTPDRLRRGPALLLWTEAIVAAVGTVAGLLTVVDRGGRTGRGGVAVRRTAGALLFGLHTIRFWIYLSPDQGRRAIADAAHPCTTADPVPDPGLEGGRP